MRTRLALAISFSLLLSGCALYAPSAGNPNADAYVGNASSTYESAVNPARTVGRVAYDPSGPLPASSQLPTPSDDEMLPPPQPRPRTMPR